jgi:acyl carrier protein
MEIKMLEKLITVIEKVVPDADTSNIGEGTRLVEDLEFDSLAIMMMSMEIEDMFGFKFTEFIKFETVGDVCRYLEEKVGK